jgi:hypothetical protein
MGMVLQCCHPSYTRRIVVQVGLATKVISYLKLSKTKRAVGVAKEVECQPSKNKPRVQTTVPPKKKKRFPVGFDTPNNAVQLLIW